MAGAQPALERVERGRRRLRGRWVSGPSAVSQIVSPPRPNRRLTQGPSGPRP